MKELNWMTYTFPFTFKLCFLNFHTQKQVQLILEH